MLLNQEYINNYFQRQRKNRKKSQSSAKIPNRASVQNNTYNVNMNSTMSLWILLKIWHRQNEQKPVHIKYAQPTSCVFITNDRLQTVSSNLWRWKHLFICVLNCFYVNQYKHLCLFYFNFSIKHKIIVATMNTITITLQHLLMWPIIIALIIYLTFFNLPRPTAATTATA